jgi:hypothetical protein
MTGTAMQRVDSGVGGFPDRAQAVDQCLSNLTETLGMDVASRLHNDDLPIHRFPLTVSSKWCLISRMSLLNSHRHALALEVRNMFASLCQAKSESRLV